MKNITKLFAAVAGIFAFALTSCDDGNVGAIYDMPEEDQGYTFFTETAGKIYDVDFTDKTYSFKMARNFAGDAEVLDLIVDGDVDVFGIPESVSFAAGETMADIVIDITNMEAGATYDFTISFDSEKVSKDGISTVEVELGVAYTWVQMGTCNVTDDWSGAMAEIPLEYALEFASDDYILCRFASMEYMLEPDYADPGYDFQFILEKDTYEPVGTAYAIQAMGEVNGEDGNLYWMYSPASGHTFTREGNIYSLSGYVGYDSYGSSVSAGWYYNMMFQWVDMPDE